MPWLSLKELEADLQPCTSFIDPLVDFRGRDVCVRMLEMYVPASYEFRLRFDLGVQQAVSAGAGGGGGLFGQEDKEERDVVEAREAAASLEAEWRVVSQSVERFEDHGPLVVALTIARTDGGGIAQPAEHAFKTLAKRTASAVERKQHEMDSSTSPPTNVYSDEELHGLRATIRQAAHEATSSTLEETTPSVRHVRGPSTLGHPPDWRSAASGRGQCPAGS